MSEPTNEQQSELSDLELRFGNDLLFGKLRNERTDQLTGGDAKAIVEWFKDYFTRHNSERLKAAEEVVRLASEIYVGCQCELGGSRNEQCDSCDLTDAIIEYRNKYPKEQNG